MPMTAIGMPTGASSNIPIGGCWYRLNRSLTTKLVDVLISVTELVRIEENASGSKNRDGLAPTLAA